MALEQPQTAVPALKTWRQAGSLQRPRGIFRDWQEGTRKEKILSDHVTLPGNTQPPIHDFPVFKSEERPLPHRGDVLAPQVRSWPAPVTSGHRKLRAGKVGTVKARSVFGIMLGSCADREAGNVLEPNCPL